MKPCVNPRSSAFLVASGLSIQAPQLLQLLLDLDLEAVIHGEIILAIAQLVRKVALACGIGMIFVVRVAIALALVEFFHELGGRVA